MRFILFASIATLLLAVNVTETSAAEVVSVMFSQNHGESYDLEGRDLLSLQKFASFIAGEGVRVYSLHKGQLDKEQLRDIDVLIISYPQENLAEAEVETIRGYVETGGGLLVLGGQQCRDYINPLLEKFGMEMTYGVIEHKGQIDFTFNSSAHELFAFVRNFQYLHAPPVKAQDPAWIAYRPEWLRKDVGLFLVRKYGMGTVIVSGDADFLNNFYLDEHDNAQLGLNLIHEAAGREAVIKRERGKSYLIFIVLFAALILAFLIFKRIRS